jgi:hypothetical protein
MSSEKALFGRAVELDRVVVVEVDEPPELEMAGEGGRLVRDALLQVAVRADGEDPVVLDLLAERRAQELLGHGHADAVGEALAERARGQLHARRHVRLVALGVAGVFDSHLRKDFKSSMERS